MVLFPIGFLSTLSLRRATSAAAASSFCSWQFLSTLSLRRATCQLFLTKSITALFLSTLSLRRATVSAVYADLADRISIHALLAESDAQYPIPVLLGGHFYPRSPCGERRNRPQGRLLCSNFYPRSPCGERPPASAPAQGGRNFYPRSPCGERPWNRTMSVPASLFLSTLSLRRATLDGLGLTTPMPYFYPRSPCGERRLCSAVQSLDSKFLSTLSLRRATVKCHKKQFLFCS